jgi:hypothetical protein
LFIKPERPMDNGARIGVENRCQFFLFAEN